jgi:hypothetical protein
LAAKPLRRDNTEVEVDEAGNVKLLLFGNAIAKRERDGDKIFIRTAGWNTATTRERLSGLPGVTVCTEKGKVFLWYAEREQLVPWPNHADWTEVPSR